MPEEELTSEKIWIFYVVFLLFFLFGKVEQRSQFKNLVVAQGGVESLRKFVGEKGMKNFR